MHLNKFDSQCRKQVQSRTDMHTRIRRVRVVDSVALALIFNHYALVCSLRAVECAKVAVCFAIGTANGCVDSIACTNFIIQILDFIEALAVGFDLYVLVVRFFALKQTVVVVSDVVRAANW